MKTLGVQTADFSVYYDLVQFLRQVEVPFVPIAPGEPVPPHVGVVVTTSAEVGLVVHDHVVAFTSPSDTVERALALLDGRPSFRTLVIGVDPGERPGIAALGDGKIVRLVHAPSPEAVRAAVDHALATLQAELIILRIGDGAPTHRDRILHTLAGLDVRLELVDETDTTPAHCVGNAARDTAAATQIALTPGMPILASEVRPVVPTPGELREIQRKSRLASHGALTISRGLARYVALGRITLEQAVDMQRQRA